MEDTDKMLKEAIEEAGTPVAGQEAMVKIRGVFYDTEDGPPGRNRRIKANLGKHTEHFLRKPSLDIIIECSGINPAQIVVVKIYSLTITYVEKKK